MGEENSYRSMIIKSEVIDLLHSPTWGSENKMDFPSSTSLRKGSEL